MTAATETTAVSDTSHAPSSETESPATTPKPSGGLDLTKGSNLLVNYIPRSITNDDLERLFSPFGAIEKARCITDRLTGSCQGYGFVQFKTAQSAAEAVLHFSIHPPPEGSAMKVSFARPAESHKLSNLHVTGLPVAYTEDDFKNLFEQFGEVCEVTLLKTPSGESRGSGFVRLETPSQAQAAVNALHDSIPPRGSSRLTVRFASGTKREAMNRVSGRVAPGYGRPYPPIPPIHTPPPLPPIAPYYAGDAYNPVAGYGGHTALYSQAQPYSSYSYGASYNPHIAALEAQLQTAIESQQYEKCASLRDQIQALMASSAVDPTYSAYSSRAPATTPAATATGSNVGAYGASAAATGYPLATPSYASSPATSNAYGTGTTSTYASNASAAAYAVGPNNAAATYSSYTSSSGSGYGPDRSKSSRPAASSAPSPYGQYGQPAPPPPVPSQQGSSGSFVLYVAGLPYDYDEQTLVMMFGQFGQVTNVKIPRDPATRMPKGYAFVTMPTQEAGAAAIIALNGYSLGSRTLQVKFRT